MARRIGNTSASSLLKQAQAAYERQQSYNDSIAAYEWELSDKTEADWNNYQKYLKERQGKTQDAMKKLELEKKITSSYRTFNSSEIQRATLAVNYGDINKTQKYNMMFGLLQRAYANGDMELAGNIESQMASLSVQIQNEASAAAGRGGSGRGGASGFTTIKNQVRQLEAEVDRAYQTGQKFNDGEGERYLNAADYARMQAYILKQKFDIASAEAANDPNKEDELSKLKASSEWRGLIDSGIITFDDNGVPIATDDRIKNLAVSFQKDKYGNNYRTFTAPDLQDGQSKQWGISKANLDNNTRDVFLVNRQLNSEGVDPQNLGRVAYQLDQFTQDGKDVKGVKSYQDVISGNKVLASTEGASVQEGGTAGLRSVAYKGKKEVRNEADALKALNELVAAQKNPGGNASPTAGGLFDFGNAADTYGGIAGSTFGKTAAKIGKSSFGAGLRTIPGVGPVLSNLFNRSQQESYKREVEAKAKAAEAARQQSIREAYARQQAAATLAAQRAATSAPRIVPTAPKGQVYLPTAKAKPADVFKAALGGNKSPQNVAKAIGKAVGYNF